MKDLLAYIGASSHSGSTLMALLLNNSPHVKWLGEIHKLRWHASTNLRPCTCGKPLLECPFWSRMEAEARKQWSPENGKSVLESRETLLVPERVGPLASAVQKGLLLLGSRTLYKLAAPLIAPQHQEACANTLFWCDVARRVTGRRVILDTSKDARRLKVLYFADPERFRLIYLLRDGRAITASAMRREHMTAAEAAHMWVRFIRTLHWAVKTIPANRMHRVRYEDFCRDPKAGMSALCRFLEIPFDEDMLVLRKDESHNVGGNPMRFRRDETTIRLDERWREQLTAEEKRTFERIGGHWNRKVGYTD